MENKTLLTELVGALVEKKIAFDLSWEEQDGTPFVSESGEETMGVLVIAGRQRLTITKVQGGSKLKLEYPNGEEPLVSDVVDIVKAVREFFLEDCDSEILDRDVALSIALARKLCEEDIMFSYFTWEPNDDVKPSDREFFDIPVDNFNAEIEQIKVKGRPQLHLTFHQDTITTNVAGLIAIYLKRLFGWD